MIVKVSLGRLGFCNRHLHSGYFALILAAHIGLTAMPESFRHYKNRPSSVVPESFRHGREANGAYD